MEETLPAKQVLGIVQPYSSAKEGEEGKGGQYHLDALNAHLFCCCCCGSTMWLNRAFSATMPRMIPRARLAMIASFVVVFVFICWGAGCLNRLQRPPMQDRWTLAAIPASGVETTSGIPDTGCQAKVGLYPRFLARRRSSE